ncbi:hypothetical protein DD238_001210 [Peronospora effusa]|nr:hypothetical protein DD238_001210 [Peronospora effusa]
MESLLSKCWWEDLIGLGACPFHFNKTVAKQLVNLYTKLLADLRSIIIAFEARNAIGRMLYCSKSCRRNSSCSNDLLEDISLEIVHPSRSMSSSTFAILKRAIEQLMEKYPIFYGNFI